mgnify:FL=1
MQNIHLVAILFEHYRSELTFKYDKLTHSGTVFTMIYVVTRQLNKWLYPIKKCE